MSHRIAIDTDADVRACKARPNDERKEPGRCVIANHIREEHPWVKNPSVGTRTIRVYDYRCEHNPEGLVGKCSECPGRRLVWATPMPWAKAIKEFDRGADPLFPAISLRVSEADIQTNNLGGRDRQRKREAMKSYHEEVRNGERVPQKHSAKARARAKSNRRKG